MPNLAQTLAQLDQASDAVAQAFQAVMPLAEQQQQQARPYLDRLVVALYALEEKAAQAHPALKPLLDKDRAGTFAGKVRTHFTANAVQGLPAPDLSGEVQVVASEAGKVIAVATRIGGASQAAPQQMNTGGVSAPAQQAQQPNLTPAQQATITDVDKWTKRIAVMSGLLQTGLACYATYETLQKHKQRAEWGVVDDDEEPVLVTRSAQRVIDRDAPGQKIQLLPRPDGQWQGVLLDRNNKVLARYIADKPNAAATKVVDAAAQHADAGAIEAKARVA